MGKMKHLWAMAQILQDIEDINQLKLDEINREVKKFNKSVKDGEEVVYLKNRINGKVKEKASWKQ
tara:strand:+ start:693 stop:887 length:195 start_codon:yes stop_codon:yes gene_type:complete